MNLPTGLTRVINRAVRAEQILPPPAGPDDTQEFLLAALHRLRAADHGGPALVHYAAAAAHRSGDPAVMCRILGCPPDAIARHALLFDRKAGHRHAARYAACRVRSRPWRDVG